MQFKRWLPVCVLLAALTMTSRASVIDPQMAVESAGDPNPFNGGTFFSPDPTDGGGVFQFYNNTGATIIAITFGAHVAMNLGTDNNPALPPLSCNMGDDTTAPNPFFTSCAPNYDPTTGELDFRFFGLSDPQTGTDKGIPPIIPGCTYDNANTSPSDNNCLQGTFSISLNFNFSLEGDSGGWGTLGNPTFTATSVQTATPEPGPGLLVGAALIAGGMLVAFRRLKRSRLAETS